MSDHRLQREGAVGAVIIDFHSAKRREAVRATGARCDHRRFSIPRVAGGEIRCTVPGGCGQALDERSVLLAVTKELRRRRELGQEPKPWWRRWWG